MIAGPSVKNKNIKDDSFSPIPGTTLHRVKEIMIARVKINKAFARYSRLNTTSNEEATLRYLSHFWSPQLYEKISERLSLIPSRNKEKIYWACMSDVGLYKKAFNAFLHKTDKHVMDDLFWMCKGYADFIDADPDLIDAEKKYFKQITQLLSKSLDRNLFKISSQYRRFFLKDIEIMHQFDLDPMEQHLCENLRKLYQLAKQKQLDFPPGANLIFQELQRINLAETGYIAKSKSFYFLCDALATVNQYYEELDKAPFPPEKTSSPAQPIKSLEPDFKKLSLNNNKSLSSVENITQLPISSNNHDILTRSTADLTASLAEKLPPLKISDAVPEHLKSDIKEKEPLILSKRKLQKQQNLTTKRLQKENKKQESNPAPKTVNLSQERINFYREQLKHHQAVFLKIFRENTPHLELKWQEIENLLHAVCGKIEQGAGSRITLVFNENTIHEKWAYILKPMQITQRGIHISHSPNQSSVRVASFYVEIVRQALKRFGLTPERIFPSESSPSLLPQKEEKSTKACP